jgi:hypothetical protein
MAKNTLNINKMLSVDATGMPQLPTLEQIQDKDVLMLFTRDKSDYRRQYIKEVGVIYYLGDPNSPANQQGLSESEALQLAIENYNLPKDYKPDDLVKKLIVKYHKANLTAAGVAIQNILKSFNAISQVSSLFLDMIKAKIKGGLELEDLAAITTQMHNVINDAKQIPSLTASLKTAYENLRHDQEAEVGRGGKDITSSMDADDDY